MEHTHEYHDHERDARGERITLVVKTALLIGLGLYFVYNIVSGNLSNYINERFGWLSYLAAALFLLIGGYSLYHLLDEYFPSSGKRKHDALDHDHDHEGHDHAPMSWGALIIVAIPLVLGTLIPSRPLGAESVDGNVSITAASSSTMTFAIEPGKRNVLDWLRVFNTGDDDYAQFSGQPVDVIGFVYVEPTFGAQQFMVARFTISCCVADASAIGLPTVWDGAVEQNTWVHVQGVIEVGVWRGEQTPLVRASTVEVVEQPAHPYLYP